jgi:hypothetical protein
MKFKCVRSISVGNLGFKTFWQVYDLNGFEGTSLDAHTTTNTKNFADKTNS